jgi:hypothetical protein
MRPSKRTVLMLTPLLTAAASITGAQEAGGLLSCASEENDTMRLGCYDREIARLMRDGMTVPVVAARIDEARLVDDFGMRGEILRKAAEKRQRENPRLERLDATVIKVATGPGGRLIVDLDNGQQWEQTQGKNAMFVKVGDDVYFTRGTLGSFFLTTEQRRSVRVRRTR